MVTGEETINIMLHKHNARTDTHAYAFVGMDGCIFYPGSYIMYHILLIGNDTKLKN